MGTWTGKNYVDVHTEVKRYLKAVADGGGVIAEARIQPLNALVGTLKSQALWNRVHDLWLPTGDFAAAFYKLKAYPGSGAKAKNMGWTGAAWIQDDPTAFQSADWVETGATGGLTGNGAKALDTGVTVGMVGTVLGGLAFYLSQSPDASSKGFIGADDAASSTNRFNLSRFAAGTVTGGMFGAATTSSALFPGTQAAGWYHVVRTSTTSLKVFRSGVQHGSTDTVDVGTPSVTHAGRFWAYCFGNDNNPNSTWVLNKRGAGYAITEAMTDTEVVNFYNAVQAFQIALGRNV
jgi:hypothetical protein